MQRMTFQFFIFCLMSFSGLVGTIHAETRSDLDTERLLAITSREDKIYKKIAEDPEFYSAADLDRRIDELILSYRTYLAENPDDVSALILYGKLLRRVEQNEQAFNAFLKADELDPKIAVVKQQLGTHLAETGKGKAALTFYLNAVELEPETPIYHFALGQLLYQFRDEFLEDKLFSRDALDREMLKAFHRAVQLDPENFDAQMRLGEAYYDFASPDWKAALLHWEKLGKTVAPDQSLRREIINLHKTRVLGKLGRAAEAKELAATILQPSLQFSKQQVLDEIAQH
jgi:cytochrome c-type biogenesis protein CcmH/NrfG